MMLLEWNWTKKMLELQISVYAVSFQAHFAWRWFGPQGKWNP